MTHRATFSGRPPGRRARAGAPLATVIAMPAPRTDVRRLAPVVALPWVLWAALRLSGTERGFPLVPAMTFTPYAAVGAVVPLAVALRTGSRSGALLSAGAGAALAAAVLARAGTSQREL